MKNRSGKLTCRTIALTLCMMVAGMLQAQGITEIITDYGNYWKSSTTAINSVTPDNSHNLLAFTINNTRYSTGVKDSILTARHDTFVAGDYRALPGAGITGTITSNTKIALGAMYDGVANGASNPPPPNGISTYLTDGPKGLNLGTGAANLPLGTMNFQVNTLRLDAIGDGIPDILITQIADPTTTVDRYQFTDAGGNVVGNYVDITFNNITPVGNWVADFYEATANPMTLGTGFTQTSRPLRLWAADFSAFGINSSNIMNISNFRINLGGNSDVAFVAYNYNAFNVTATLPIRLSSFKAEEKNDAAILTWQTASESNSDRFELEKSVDGNVFSLLATLAAAGNSTTPKTYAYEDQNTRNGTQYYRLKQYDKNGSFVLSPVVKINVNAAQTVLGIFPNPAAEQTTVKHPRANGNEQLRIVNLFGVELMKQQLSPGTTETRLNTRSLPPGRYQVVLASGTKKLTASLIIQ